MNATTPTELVIISPGRSCPPAPQFTVLIHGQPLGNLQATGFGDYCLANIDGVASDFLLPVETRPGEVISLVHQSSERWDRLIYRVYNGHELVGEQTLPAHTEIVALPGEPGAYTISLAGESEDGRLYTVFKVVASP